MAGRRLVGSPLLYAMPAAASTHNRRVGQPQGPGMIVERERLLFLEKRG